MTLSDFEKVCRVADKIGIKTVAEMGDYAERMGLTVEQFAQEVNENVLINGIPATNGDIAELDHRLRLGIEKVYAKCYNGTIHYTVKF